MTGNRQKDKGLLTGSNLFHPCQAREATQTQGLMRENLIIPARQLYEVGRLRLTANKEFLLSYKVFSDLLTFEKNNFRSLRTYSNIGDI